MRNMGDDQQQLHVCDASVSLAFTILGKRWNGLILATLGAGPMSFTVLRRTVTGISDAVLSDRLSELTEATLLSRHVDPGPPVTVSYSLTPAGERLLPVLQQLGDWAADNLDQARRA